MLKRSLSRVLPKPLRKALRAKFLWSNQNVITRGKFHRAFFPHRSESDTYIVPRVPEAPVYHEISSLPLPPRHLRSGYGRTDDEWLLRGKQDVQTMRNLLQEQGIGFESAQRILEFGCAAGRMIRWLADIADQREIWGTDVSSSHIIWCKQYLPEFHFATTTLFPHLPFEDRYFDIIYAGSVFTHIDDLDDAWFQELRRILRPGGMLYITINDRHGLSLIRLWKHDLERIFERYPEFERYAHSDFGMFTIGRHEASQVVHHIDYLRRSLEPFFRIRAVLEEAYWHQTALVIERVS